MKLIEIIEILNTKEACINYLEGIRWSGSTVCPYCGSTKNSPMKKEYRHHCNTCKTSFSVLVGTIFESSKVPLSKWFIAIRLILDAKKGISSRQLARHISVTKDTAWYMQKRLRDAMNENNSSLLKGIIETDETYIGGDIKNKHKKVRDELHSSGIVKTGTMHKLPVFGLLERKGKVYTQVVTHTDGKTLKSIIYDKVDKSSIIVSDGFGAYYGLNKSYQGHKLVNHSQDEYVNGEFHTNNIESFWSLIKRGIVGQYHKISKRYLQNYLDEFSFKYNNKEISNIFEYLLSNALITSKINKLATYT